MYPVSEKFKKAINSNVRSFFHSGKITTKLEKEYIFTDDDILKGSGYITDQCSSSGEIEIGSVYAKEIGITLFSDIDRYSLFGARLEIFFNLRIGKEIESLALGVFEISEANRTLNLLEIKGYDYMLRLDKNYDGKLSGGYAYDFLLYIAESCNVNLKNTKEEIESLANGKTLLGIYHENDIESYRDLLHYIAKVLGGFFTFNRNGLLEYKKFSSVPVATLEKKHIYKSSFSDFYSKYTAIYSSNIKTKKSEYYALEIDDGLTMNLGVNPLLQFGLDKTRKEVLENILDDVKDINFIPFDAETIGNPALDIGDAIEFIGDDKKISVITRLNYKLGGKHTIKCSGKNPHLKGVKSKSDKNITGLINKIESGKIVIHSFVNISEFKLTKDFSPLISIEFATSEDTDAMFNAQILFDVLSSKIEKKIKIGKNEKKEDVFSSFEIDGKTSVEIKYILNDSEINTFMPKESYSSGRHTLALFYPLSSLKAGVYNTFKVLLKCTGGDVKVGRSGAIAAISGQGLSAGKIWDGRIEMTESIETLDLKSKYDLKAFTDSFVLEQMKPKASLIFEKITALKFGGLPLENLKEHLRLNPVIVTETIDVYDKKKMEYNRYFVNDALDFRLKTDYKIKSKEKEIDKGRRSVTEFDKNIFKEVISLEVRKNG